MNDVKYQVSSGWTRLKSMNLSESGSVSLVDGIVEIRSRTRYMPSSRDRRNLLKSPVESNSDVIVVK